MLAKPVVGKFDLAHLQEIHKRLFGDVYAWAGELRQVELSREATNFAAYAQIESAGHKLFGELAKEDWRRNLDVDTFSQRAGFYLGEINALHPFREGNGRAQREFLSQLSQQAGYQLDWTDISEAAMVRASAEAFFRSPDELSALILRGIQRGDQTPKIYQSVTQKRRLLVRNGEVLLQVQSEAYWQTVKIEKSGNLAPGIYNIYLAEPAKQRQTTRGLIVYNDGQYIFQKTRPGMVMHDLACFQETPLVGKIYRIQANADEKKFNQVAEVTKKKIVR